MVAIGRTAVKEQDHDLVATLGSAKVVPEHVNILHMRLWVTLLGVVGVGGLGYLRWRARQH